MNVRTTGEATVRLLEGYGVRHVFGIPGVHTFELYRGLAASSVEHVLPRHEQGAGFMADGYARATGRPGVCFLVTGPGVTNTATAVGEAYANSIPMLVISSVAAVSDHGRQRGRLHETREQLSPLGPVTAFTATALLPQDVPEYVARAFALFESDRPRPVHLQIPLDVLAAPPSGDWSGRRPSARPGPRPQDAARAAGLLVAAERPALICGGGAWGAQAQIRELVERLALPTLCTIGAKGLLPGEHPLSLGAGLSRAAVRAFLAQCDVVLAVGTELAESELLTTEPLPLSGELIRVDIDRVQLLDEQQTTLPICSDAAAALDAVQAHVRQLAAPAGSVLDARRATTARVADELRGELTEAERAQTVVLDAMRDALPARTWTFADMTTIAYTGNVTYRVPDGGRWVHPAGYGSLGYALPAAIGAAVGGAEPVVALIGDGGLQFTLPELATLAERRLPVTVVVWNNRGYEKIREGMLELGVTPIGVDYVSPQLDLLGEAYGIAVRRPESVASFSEALGSAVANGRPSLIELTPAVVDPSAGGAIELPLEAQTGR